MLNSKVLAKYIYDNDPDMEVLYEVLRKYNYHTLLPNTIKQLKLLKSKYKLSTELVIESPFNLNEENINKIKKLVGATGAYVINKNADLLAGFKAKYNNRVYDASVQSKLLK